MQWHGMPLPAKEQETYMTNQLFRAEKTVGVVSSSDIERRNIMLDYATQGYTVSTHKVYGVIVSYCLLITIWMLTTSLQGRRQAEKNFCCSCKLISIRVTNFFPFLDMKRQALNVSTHFYQCSETAISVAELYLSSWSLPRFDLNGLLGSGERHLSRV